MTALGCLTIHRKLCRNYKRITKDQWPVGRFVILFHQYLSLHVEECNDVLMWRKLVVTFCRVSLWIWLCRSFFSSTSLASSSLSSSFSCLMIRSLSAGLLFYIQQSTAALTPRTLQKKWNPFQVTEHPLIPLSPQSTSNHTVQHLWGQNLLASPVLKSIKAHS